MQVAHVSASRADTHVWGSAQTWRLLLIDHRRPQADDARASRLRTPQGQVNNFGHITLTFCCLVIRRGQGKGILGEEGGGLWLVLVRLCIHCIIPSVRRNKRPYYTQCLLTMCARFNFSNKILNRSEWSGDPTSTQKALRHYPGCFLKAVMTSTGQQLNLSALWDLRFLEIIFKIYPSQVGGMA